MGNSKRDKWFEALPWVMLGRRVSYQPNLDASAAQMVLNMSPRIPGQLLGHPGPPLSNAQVKALLDQLYRMADRQPVQTSGKRSFLDINDKTEDVTHVYVKVDKPESLCPKFEGPYKVLNRPSRSTVEVQVGVKKDGEPRTLILHWTSCKPAHLRDGASEGCRPMLGRRPKNTSGSVNTPGTNNSRSFQIQDGGPNRLSEPAVSPDVEENPPNSNVVTEPPNHSRPVRATRNKNPMYVDSLSFYSRSQGGSW